jgi:flagella basal body P-ring formation protein FlgA
VKTFPIFAAISIAIWIAPCARACQLVEGDHILAGDLAAASPAFGALDSTLPIVAAPAPGVRRVFLPEDVTRLARLNGIVLPLPAVELCFERATEKLTPEALMPVLRAALALDGAQIEILDFSRFGVPRGTLSFSRTGLSPAGLSFASLWRGRIIYDQSRTTPVWVRVHITLERTWVEAASRIPAGKLIETSQIVLRKGPRFPFGPAPLDALELAALHKPLRAIRRGEPIFASMLTKPCEVERGDLVRVEVSSGRAHLEFDAVAQSTAHAGESVLVKNPENGGYFQAHVEAKGKVSVIR